MGVQKYPVGVQTFREIIENGYVYVDKTGYIPLLADGPKYIFLSRPRRFGKSLLLSTLHEYFAGHRELFHGLAVDRAEIDWSPRPVIHIDFNSEDYNNPEGLEIILDRILREYELEYNIIERERSFSGRFIRLLRTAHEMTGQPVVILVDEYDKPLLGIEENPDLYAARQSMLKSFFGVLKSEDRHIRFAMLTGVARFSKVSIFSDLNNLRDISLNDMYADICGISEKELLKYFRPGIENLAAHLGKDYDSTVEKLRYFYDGYLFAEHGSRLFNPFSLLNALEDCRLGYYWYETGTPTFLMRRLKANDYLLPTLNSEWRPRMSLSATGLDDHDPVPLLFQTGYLTIKRVDDDYYELHFPNHEVEKGFATGLLPWFAPSLADYKGDFSVRQFMVDLREGNPDRFMTRMQTLLKSVPYEQHNEKFYQNLVYLLFVLLGADARVEKHTYKGRIDLIVRMEDFVYLFEFKYDRSVDTALDQIKDRDYAGMFEFDHRKIFLIGASFSASERGIVEWEIESFEGKKKH